MEWGVDVVGRTNNTFKEVVLTGSRKEQDEEAHRQTAGLYRHWVTVHKLLVCGELD